MEFVGFELAKKLKEKGFPQHWSDDDYITENEECECHFEVGVHYNRCFIPEHLPTIAAPTISQVLKWLREEKKLHIEIYMYHNCYLWEIYNTEIYDVDFTQKSEKYSEIEYTSYEDAALAGIEYVLDNLI